MKWIVALLIVASNIAQAQSSAGSELAQPPINPGQPDLTIRGQFHLPKQLVKTVVVTGYGDTPTLARYDGFRTAIEQVVGVAIVSETQVNNQRIQRDQTATYSQARVSSFHVLEQGSTPRGWATKMWVTVRGICERSDYTCVN